MVPKRNNMQRNASKTSNNTKKMLPRNHKNTNEILYSDVPDSENIMEMLPTNYQIQKTCHTEITTYNGNTSLDSQRIKGHVIHMWENSKEMLPTSCNIKKKCYLDKTKYK